MDNDTIDRRLRGILDHDVAQPPSAGLDPVSAVEYRVARRRRRRALRRVVAGGAAVVLIIAGIGVGFALNGGSSNDDTVVASPPADERDTTPDRIVIDPGGVEQFPASPLEFRGDAAVIWTGEEVVVWGGDIEAFNTGVPGPDRQYTDGAAFDPVAGTWRTMSDSPLPATSDTPVGTTTDVGVVIARGASAALWDPANDSWRALGDAPAQVDDLAFTGSEIVSHSANAVLDLESGTWQGLPEPPVRLERPTTAWTGELLVVVGGPGTPFTSAEAIAYDPETGDWRPLADPPGDLGAQALSADWDGDRVVVVNYDMRAATYDPVADSWSDLPSVPAQFSEWSPTLRSAGGSSVAFMGNAVVLLGPDDAWLPVPYGEILGGAVSGPSSLPDPSRGGDTLFVWGVRDDMNELVGLDIPTINAAPGRIQVGAGSVDVPEDWSVAPGDPTAFLPYSNRDFTIGLIGPSGTTCSVRSAPVAGGTRIQGAVEKELENDGEPHTWRRDDAGLTWQTTPGDIFTVTCDRADMAEILARSASFLTNQF